MIETEPGAGSRVAVDLAIPQETPERSRDRVAVRRRRGSKTRPHARRWAARSSRGRFVRTFLVCTGVLMLMALGLYYGLSHQESAPADGASRDPGTLIALRTRA